MNLHITLRYGIVLISVAASFLCACSNDAGNTSEILPAISGSELDDINQQSEPLVLSLNCESVPESGMCSTGISEFTYMSSQVNRVGRAATHILPVNACGTTVHELWLESSDELTDLFIKLPIQSDAGIEPSVVWSDAVSDRFLKMAVLTGGYLKLSVAGIRQCSADELATCRDSSALADLLSQRNSLNGQVQICSISWSAADKTDSANPTELVIDARKRISTPGEVDPVGAVSVRIVDGQYEIGWPQRLTADYNQDGEVNGMDLTPVGILYGLKSYGYNWVLESAARVDGDGNGQITAADLTPLGYNYGNQLFDFRVEKSVGDESGPGASWESVGVYGRSTVTQYDDPVTATSDVPYQRILTAVEPGWVYYRVVAIEGGGWEAEPSPAVLAPDATPLKWTANPELTYDDSDPYSYYFTYNETATDDRGVVYGFDIVGGEGDPDDLGIMLHITPENSKEPIASPYRLGQFNFPFQDPGEYRGISMKEGDTYYLRMAVSDSSGSLIYSDWCSFTAKYGTNEFQNTKIADNWDVWVGRDGTVRFTPPTVYTYRGLSPTDISIYHKLTTLTDEETYNNVDDYDPSTRQSYSSGELVWDQIIPVDQQLWILLAVTDPDGTVWESFFRIHYPSVWYKPFDFLDDGASFSAIGMWDFPPDDRPMLGAWHPSEEFQVLGSLEGGSIIMSSLEDIPLGAMDDMKMNDITGEILFHSGPSVLVPGEVYWYDHPYGVTGYAQEPAGEFGSYYHGFDNIRTYEAESEDVLIGVRGRPVAGEDTELGIEVWEAHRDGDVSLRETVYPMELKSSDYAEILPVRDGQLSMVIHVESGTTGIGGILYHDYYAFREPDESWLVIDGRGDLPGFDPTDWVDIDYFVYSPTEATSYVVVYAASDVIIDADSGNYLQYGAVYQGSMKAGYSSFSKLYDYRNDEVFHPDEGMMRNAYFTLVKPYDGHAICNNRESYIISPDGTVSRTGFYLGVYDMDVQFRWSNHQYVPTFACGAVSEDGEWRHLTEEGTWGFAFWNER